MIQTSRPLVVCEIGALCGGSLYLFSQGASADATMISIDTGFTWPKQRAFPLLAKDSQTVRCLRADSHQPSTVNQVQNLLAGRMIDMLFIDGDHSYEGVYSDFNKFSPLVAKKGIIAFYDVVPDFQMRFGRKENADSGGVPIFWNEIKSRFAEKETLESIEDHSQDGFGIGVLIWPGEKAGSV